MVWATHCNRECQVNHSGILNNIFSNAARSLCHKHTPISVGGKCWWRETWFTYSYKLGNPTYWTFPIYQLSSWNNSIHTCNFPRGIQRNFWRSQPETDRDVKTSQIQAGSKHNVPFDHFNSLTELVLQVCVANVLCGLTQLPQYLFQSSHAADDAAWTENSSFWIQVTGTERH